jgi:hypothetical protein
MVLPEVEEQLKTLCSSDVKHIVLFGIEVRYLIDCYLASSDQYFCYIWDNNKFTIKINLWVKRFHRDELMADILIATHNWRDN